MKPQLILFYNTMWNKPLTYPKADIPEGFELTTDRRFMQDAVAVVFHIPSLHPIFLRYKRLSKKKGQIWVAWSMECEVNYPHFLNPSFMRSFDLTMTHHLDADIIVPYFGYTSMNLFRGSVKEKSDERIACAFISSSFNKSGRLEYLKALMRYINVHSYGNVLRNRIIEKDTGHQTKMDIIAGYKFTIAFENAIAKDYVTEKFFDPLIAGSVPIYLGAPNIDIFAPGDKCFINASDWDNPESLARYILAVSEDEELYQDYLEWKTKPFRPGFIKLIEQQREHAFVRLCKEIQKIR